MALHSSGGSMGDLSALDEGAPMAADSTGSPGGAVTAAGMGVGVGLQLRKSRAVVGGVGGGGGALLRLDQLKQEKLKSVRDSCSWGSGPIVPPPQVRNTKLPPIPAGGKQAICLICLTHTHTDKIL